jgi:hypothetical protein
MPSEASMAREMTFKGDVRRVIPNEDILPAKPGTSGSVESLEELREKSESGTYELLYPTCHQ